MYTKMPNTTICEWYEADMSCNITKRFPSERAMNMWVKLHKKKCEICKLNYNPNRSDVVQTISHFQTMDLVQMQQIMQSQINSDIAIA